jgi:hypothetical protein
VVTAFEKVWLRSQFEAAQTVPDAEPEPESEGEADGDEGGASAATEGAKYPWDGN